MTSTKVRDLAGTLAGPDTLAVRIYACVIQRIVWQAEWLVSWCPVTAAYRTSAQVLQLHPLLQLDVQACPWVKSNAGGRW